MTDPSTDVRPAWSPQWAEAHVALKGRESRYWRRQWRFWRIQIGFRLMCHQSASATDRWVLHPSFVYDRKRRSRDHQATVDTYNALNPNGWSM